MQSIFEIIENKDNVMLSTCTTFRVGGPAKKILYPKNVEQIIMAVDYCRKNSEKYMILGNGSNILFPDKGYDGIIIQIYTKMNKVDVDGETIYAEAGASLARIANTAKQNSLTGFEFAAGIPGTVGGAVVMNAGAYGGEMKDVVEYADILCSDGEVKRFTNEELQFSYRHSVIDKEMVVLGAGIRLAKGNISEIEARMNELKEARLSKQPLEYPSAGSTFKRPEGYFAGKLIEDSGLKGFKCGGAMVSDKHSGFIINYDDATCDDILNLIEHVQNTVFDKFGVRLEPEVKIIK